jgi:hypothetical protein
VSLAHTHRDPHRRSPSSTKGDALVLIVWGFLALLVVSRIKLPDAAPPPPPSQARPPQQS